MSPGARAKAHLHAGHESAIYLISGTVEFWSGPALERHDTVEAGEFVVPLPALDGLLHPPPRHTAG